jgi:two-component system OmpR family response regulator
MRVLVVEDEPRMADLLARGLHEEGYAVDRVGDGDEAIWLAEQVPYDAIVLDVMIPGRDGMEVCRHLRAGGSATPVLLLTARDDVSDRVDGLDSGADDYLTKPFSFAELYARLRALTRRPTTSLVAPPLAVGDLQLDPATRQVWRAGQAVNLSPREFSLLELFVRHAGETLTRRRVLDEVWDEVRVDSNVVDQYVGYLRRKVDKPFGRSDIETVRGRGYRLRAA